MNKEELVNLNMKDIILNKWKSKLSYPFRQTDLEELENIINYYEEENKQLKEQYCERTDCGGRLGNSKKVEELIKENEILKRQIDIKDRYCQLIIDLGYNYDGFNAAENLKGLIDQLVDYAYKAKENDDKSAVYENAEEKPLNILMEEVKE